MSHLTWSFSTIGLVNKASATNRLNAGLIGWKVEPEEQKFASDVQHYSKSRGGVSAKTFGTETLTLLDRDFEQKLETRPRLERSETETRLLKPNVCNILQIFLTLNFGHSVNFLQYCNIDF